MGSSNGFIRKKIAIHHSKFLLFGLLVRCPFSRDEEKSCPLSELRKSLSIEEKYDYVMKLTAEEINAALEHHDNCYKKKISAIS